MSAQDIPRPVWFLPGTRDLLGVSTISIGTVIGSPWRPKEWLNEDEPPAIPSNLTRPSPDELDWSWTNNTQKSLSGGLFASVLQLFGLRGDLKGSTKQNHSIAYTADKLTTEEFAPNKSYFAKIIADPGVQNAFKVPNPKTQVYLVTGLKKAFGATRTIESNREQSSDANFKVKSPALGELGPEAHVSFKVGDKLSSGKMDFIFGLKLKAVTYKNGQVRSEDYEVGASYGREDPQGDVEELNMEDFDLEDLTDMSEEDFLMRSQDVVFEEDGQMKEVRLFHPGEEYLREQ